MKKIAVATSMLLLFAPILMAQMHENAPVANPVTTTVRQMEGHYAKNLVGAAEEMPADKYSYRPTAEQMTFAHLVMHVAESNNSLCAAVAGQQPRASKLSEKDSKDMLTRVLKDSFAYCEQVLAKADDSTLGQTAVLFEGRTGTRAAALLYLVSGWADHYGGAATYLRLNNLLPPSAKKAAGK